MAAAPQYPRQRRSSPRPARHRARPAPPPARTEAGRLEDTNSVTTVGRVRASVKAFAAKTGDSVCDGNRLVQCPRWRCGAGAAAGFCCWRKGSGAGGGGSGRAARGASIGAADGAGTDRAGFRPHPAARQLLPAPAIRRWLELWESSSTGPSLRLPHRLWAARLCRRDVRRRRRGRDRRRLLAHRHLRLRLHRRRSRDQDPDRQRGGRRRHHGHQPSQQPRRPGRDRRRRVGADKRGRHGLASCARGDVILDPLYGRGLEAAVLPRGKLLGIEAVRAGRGQHTLHGRTERPIDDAIAVISGLHTTSS